MCVINELPQDVIWLILKCYLGEVLAAMNALIPPMDRKDLHVFEFFGQRSKCWWEFDKTFCENVKSEILNAAYFIDFAFPLRLVCKKFDVIMRNKMPKRTQPNAVYGYSPRIAILY